MTGAHRLFQFSVALMLMAGTAAAFAQTQEGGQQPADRNEVDAPSQVIYGRDDRRDYGDPRVTPGQKLAAHATALVVMGRVRQFSKYVGESTTFGMPARSSRFCSPEKMSELRSNRQLPANYPNEPFDDDRILSSQSSCTAFKVGPDLVATAGHCAGTKSNTTACSNLNFVFHFHKSATKPAPEKVIFGRDVYYCKEIIAREHRDTLDWALIRVDREITAPQVSIRTSAMPSAAVGEPLTLIGHPAGLPLKIAAGGKITGFRQHNFLANLDAYGGNSGSPIFNSARLDRGELLVEGILQGGSPDYVDWCNNPSSSRITPSERGRSCDCRVSYRCHFNARSAKECEGENGVYARFLENALRRATAQRTSKRP